MTAYPKSVIKTFFETNDKPTQQQFADLIDSYADTSAVATSFVGDVTATINNGVATTTISPRAVNLAKQAFGTTGSIVYFAASGVPTELAIGASGQVLTAVGGFPSYVSAAPVAGVFPNNGYASGRFYYGVAMQAGSGVTLVTTANRHYATVFAVGSPTTFTKIGIEITSGAGSLARLGIYNFSNGVPGSLVLDAGTVATNTIGQKEISISQSLQPGVYVLTAVFDNTPTVRSQSFTVPLIMPYFGNSDTDGTVLPTGIYNSLTFGALPNPFGGSITYTNGSGNIPLIWLRP